MTNSPGYCRKPPALTEKLWETPKVPYNICPIVNEESGFLTRLSYVRSYLCIPIIQSSVNPRPFWESKR